MGSNYSVKITKSAIKDIRRLLIYSYALLYRIEEENREVIILRILSNYTDWQ